jgi:UDP-N-acetylglucosamine 2-epimerase (non-hydrolysing)
MTKKNKKIRVMIVFGTRPEAIKMALLINILKNNPIFHVCVCVTGQHREMLDSVLNFFELSPDYDLNIMSKNQNLSKITSKVLLGLEQVFSEFSPDLVMVHGDTTTTLAAAISAYYHQIPLAHVEAGLRTGNSYSPWPEEINRKLVASIASLNFAPTEHSRKNLLKENISSSSIFVTGNTVIDTLFFSLSKIQTDDSLMSYINTQFHYLNYEKKIILVTGHRRENFGDGFKSICQALLDISKRDDVQIVYPVHLNPNVKEPVMTYLDGVKNITLIEPLDYLPFVYLMSKAHIILTDSGGIQEEAPSLNKPVLVMREKTERQEALEEGIVKLVGISSIEITNSVTELLENPNLYDNMTNGINPYGDGLASKRIESILLEKYPYKK